MLRPISSHSNHQMWERKRKGQTFLESMRVLLLKLTNRKPECFWPETGQTQSRLDGVCGERIKEGMNKRWKAFGVFFHFWLFGLPNKEWEHNSTCSQRRKNDRSLKYLNCFHLNTEIKWKCCLFFSVSEVSHCNW